MRDRPVIMAGREPDVEPLLRALEVLAGFLATVEPGRFRTPVAGTRSSAGAQVRQALDHVVSFLDGARSGRIDYRIHPRGTAVEASPILALAALRSVQNQLRRLPAWALRRPVSVVDRLSPAAPPVTLPSTMSRELAFLVRHTGQQSALLGALELPLAS